MAIHEIQGLTIRGMSDILKSPKGHLYVECIEDDLGTVAFWGSNKNRKNIQRIQEVEPPFGICICGAIKPNATYWKSGHRLWIPESAGIFIIKLKK